MPNPTRKEIKVVITCPCERKKEIPKTFVVEEGSAPAPAEFECPYCDKMIQVTLPNTTVKDGDVIRSFPKK